MTLARAKQWATFWREVLGTFCIHTTQLVAATNVDICRKCRCRHGLEDLPELMQTATKVELVRRAQHSAKRARFASGRYGEAILRCRALVPIQEIHRDIN